MMCSEELTAVSLGPLMAVMPRALWGQLAELMCLGAGRSPRSF